MILDYEFDNYTNYKELPKEYLILKLRMRFNRYLLEEGLIPFEIYGNMQRLLVNKMNSIILKNV